MFHPNGNITKIFISKIDQTSNESLPTKLVYADGGICLDILQNRWSPTYDVSAILTSIQVSRWSFFVLDN